MSSLAALWMLPSSLPLPTPPGPSTAGVTQHCTPTREEPGPPCPLGHLPLTLLEVVEAPELHQAVAIVVVGDIDAVILGCRVLHPGPLIAPVAVVLRGGLHGLDSALALHLLYWVPRGRKRKAYPCPRQPTPPPSPWQITAGLAWPGALGTQGWVPPAHPPLFGVSGSPVLSAPCPRAGPGGLRAVLRGAGAVLGAAVVMGTVVSVCATAWAGVPSTEGGGGLLSSCCSDTIAPLAGPSVGGQDGG